MLLLALLMAQKNPAPVPADVLAAYRMDMHAFEVDDKNLGVRRIMPIKMKPGTHFTFPMTIKGLYKFLAGNRTERITKENIRTTYVVRHPPYERRDPKSGKVITVKDVAPQELTEAKVQKLIQSHFGTDFRDTLGGRDAFGYRIPATKKCLSCHTWAKEGDSLGYLVYAVDKAK